VYATIRIYKDNPDLADKLAARADEVKSVIGNIQGFRDYYLIRTEAGAASVTVCDDENGAEETNRAAAAWIRENMPEASGNPPQILAGEVVLSA
jgi:hypothetical protein